MVLKHLDEELLNNAYPGRGIVLGRSKDNKNAVIAYFIMGRSENSRNRIFRLPTMGFGQKHTILQNLKILTDHLSSGSCFRRKDNCYKRRPNRHHS